MLRAALARLCSVACGPTRGPCGCVCAGLRTGALALGKQKIFTPPNFITKYGGNAARLERASPNLQSHGYRIHRETVKTDLVVSKKNLLGVCRSLLCFSAGLALGTGDPGYRHPAWYGTSGRSGIAIME